MRWVNLVTAAIFAACLAAGSRNVWLDYGNTFFGVLEFGLFLDGCLERHRP